MRPAMSYMDQRAVKEKHAGIEKGIRIAGHERAQAPPVSPHHGRRVSEREGPRLEIPLGARE